MQAVRAFFVVIAILGGITASASSYASFKSYGADLAAHAIAIALVGFIGTTPGIMLFGLVTPIRQE